MIYLLLVIYYHVTKAEIKAGSSPCQTGNRDTAQSKEFAV